MHKYILLFLIATLLVNGIYGGDVDEVIKINRKEFENLKATVSRLEIFAENQVLLNRRLESDLDKQREVIKDLQDVISQQAEKIQRLEELPRQTEAIKSGTPTIQKKSVKSSSKIKRYAENSVAFFATLSKSHVDHLGLHQNVVFEDVVTNISNAYNTHQGVFVAPVSGLYLITTGLRSRNDREFWAAVVVNGTEIVKLNGRGTDNRHGTGAQTAIITLKKGDDVSIQNIIQSDDDYWGDKYSSFGGFLIQEFETDSSVIVG